jgi:integrase
MSDPTDDLLGALRERAVPSALTRAETQALVDEVERALGRRRSDLLAARVLATLACLAALLVFLAMRADDELTAIRVALDLSGGIP